MKRAIANAACLALTGWILAGSGGTRLWAEDWPQFRGPGGLGASRAKGLPLKWGPEENLAWKTDLPGRGSSSPIVAGHRIFLTCYSSDNVSGGGGMNQLKLHVLGLDRDGGKILWTRDVEPVLPEQPKITENHGYATPTPAADGNRLYVFFGKSGVLAFDFEGKQLWRTDVGSGLHGWGCAASPIIVGDLVIVNASVESRSLVALDKATGQEAWRVKGITDTWSTPLLVPLKDKKPELVVARSGKVLGFDPATGEQLWTCANDITWYIVPGVVAADGVLWSLGGRSGTAAAALRAGGRGDVTQTHRLWTGKKGSNVTSPVIHEGRLYWMHENEGIAYCAEGLTGNIIYGEKVPGAGQIYASALLADGKIYYVCRSGRVFVLAAKPAFEILAANEPLDTSAHNASPAVAGNRLLIRSDKALYCLGPK